MAISEDELKKLEQEAEEIRKQLIKVVSANGGHLASNLGAVELTLALHHEFDFSKDKLLFDVGHQSYVHKILTGRKDKMDTLRQRNGIAPFMDPQESKYDPFISGHAGTALSAGAGIAMACPNDRVIVVVGDASITNGHSLEALNNIGGKFKNMIIILNDNEMSIGHNVGSLSRFLGKIMTSKNYIGLRDEIKNMINKVQKANKVLNTLERMELSVKNFFLPLSVLESLGYKYLGSLDGNNISELIDAFQKMKKMEGPIFVHVRTQKGKGYHFAEENQEKFHGISSFDQKTGTVFSHIKTYSSIFGEELIKMADEDKNIYAISAAMVKGTGLEAFFEKNPNRSIDVGIAEGHAITFAAGLAISGKKPYVAIYSTFIQRGFSQLIHDVSLQGLPVRFIVDRAGIVGADGRTHNGLYDLDMFLTIPGYTVIAPTTAKELVDALKISQNYNSGPMMIRMPREAVYDLPNDGELVFGKWKTVCHIGDNAAKDNLFIATGSMLKEIIEIKDELIKRNISGTIVSAASIKPFDSEFLLEAAPRYKNIFVLEEAFSRGSFGTMILEYLNKNGIIKKVNEIGIDIGAVPHGQRKLLMEELGLSGIKLAERIEEYINARK